MTAHELISNLEQGGMKPCVVGEKLVIEGAKTRLTVEQREKIKALRIDVIQLLTGRQITTKHIESSQPEQTPKSEMAKPKAVRAETIEPSRRETLPSPIQMRVALKWFCTFDMAFRKSGRCQLEPKCEFLIDWLPDELRREFEERGDLRWRDWNTCYTSLERELEESRHLMTQRLKGLDAQIGIDIDWSVPMTTADLEDLLQCLEHMVKEVHQP